MPGDLAESSPVDLCLRLATERATGTLALSGPDGDVVLVFADGNLVGGAPTGTTRGSRLGERLVSAGRLDRPALDAVLADQAEPAGPALGRLLIERGLASSDAVRLFVQEQLIEALLTALPWASGAWEFSASTGGDPGPVRVSVPVQRALTEVRRRAAERDRVTATVPSPAVVAAPTATADGAAGLPHETAVVLEALDGTRTVAEVAARVGQTADEVSRHLFRLVLQGRARIADTLQVGVTTPAQDIPAMPDEEPALHASPATGSSSVHLTDDGWAQRRQDAATTVDEPEPWVGWATASAERVQAAQAERRPVMPSAPGAAPAPRRAPEPEPAPTRAMDADTRRALFSELHEMGRANPGLAQPSAPAPAATPQPSAAQDPPPQPDVPEEVAEPDATPSLSRSDVSDLLRELHALNLDDDR